MARVRKVISSGSFSNRQRAFTAVTVPNMRQVQYEAVRTPVADKPSCDGAAMTRWHDRAAGMLCALLLSGVDPGLRPTVAQPAVSACSWPTPTRTGTRVAALTLDRELDTHINRYAYDGLFGIR